MPPFRAYPPSSILIIFSFPPVFIINEKAVLKQAEKRSWSVKMRQRDKDHSSSLEIRPRAVCGLIENVSVVVVQLFLRLVYHFWGVSVVFFNQRHKILHASLSQLSRINIWRTRLPPLLHVSPLFMTLPAERLILLANLSSQLLLAILFDVVTEKQDNVCLIQQHSESGCMIIHGSMYVHVLLFCLW